MLHEAIIAAKYLELEDISLKVVNMPWLNRVDPEWLINELMYYSYIFILDDHSTVGGLGDFIIYNALSFGYNDNIYFKKFGLDEYPVCGTPQEVLKYHKLDGKSLAERIANKSIISFNNEVQYSVETPQ
jgi:transketolase